MTLTGNLDLTKVMKVQHQISDDKVTMCSPMVGVNQTIMMAPPVVPHCKVSANAEAMNIRDSAELSSPHLCLGW
jgi:hypothetical protein